MRKMHAAYGKESTVKKKTDLTYCRFLDTNQKKSQSRGPRHGPSLRQTMYHKARDTLRKAKLPKNGRLQDAKYRGDLSEHGRTEEQIRQYEALALKDHSYEATPTERRRWEKNRHHFFIKKDNKVQ